MEEIALMRKAVFNDVEINKKIANKRRYTVRAISTAIMRWNANMLQNFRSQTTLLHDDIPLGTEFFPPVQPAPSVHGPWKRSFTAYTHPTTLIPIQQLSTTFKYRDGL